MATSLKNLSVFEGEVPSAREMKFGIVVAEWNWQITGTLLKGAIDTLKEYGCDENDIIVKKVPGTFELPLGAQFFAEYTDVDAVIVLGCVIQGETRHFDFIRVCHFPHKFILPTVRYIRYMQKLHIPAYTAVIVKKAYNALVGVGMQLLSKQFKILTVIVECIIFVKYNWIVPPYYPLFSDHLRKLYKSRN